jgi:hypothetical protein
MFVAYSKEPSWKLLGGTKWGNLLIAAEVCLVRILFWETYVHTNVMKGSNFLSSEVYGSRKILLSEKSCRIRVMRTPAIKFSVSWRPWTDQVEE